MIKFGNDIVTVGGDWLKYEEPVPEFPKLLREVPLTSYSLTRNDDVQSLGNYGRLTNINWGDYLVVKVNYHEINGPLRVLVGFGGGDDIISFNFFWYDVATSSPYKMISPYYSNDDSSSPAYSDPADFNGSNQGDDSVRLNTTPFITRIIFQRSNRKIYFYDMQNNLIMTATSTREWSSQTTDYISTMIWNPESTSHTSTLKAGVEYWGCATMEQALSV